MHISPVPCLIGYTSFQGSAKTKCSELYVPRRDWDDGSNRRWVESITHHRASDGRPRMSKHGAGERLLTVGLGSGDTTPEWVGGSALTRTGGQLIASECDRVEVSIPFQVQQQGALVHAFASTIKAVLCNRDGPTGPDRGKHWGSTEPPPCTSRADRRCDGDKGGRERMLGGASHTWPP